MAESDERAQPPPADATPRNFLNYATPAPPPAPDTFAWLRIGSFIVLVILAGGLALMASFLLSVFWLCLPIAAIYVMYARTRLRQPLRVSIVMRVMSGVSVMSAASGFVLVYNGTERHPLDLLNNWSIYKLVDGVQTGLWMMSGGIVVLVVAKVIAIIGGRKLIAKERV